MAGTRASHLEASGLHVDDLHDQASGPGRRTYHGTAAGRPVTVAYLDRDDIRPGMITPEVVSAFADIGWSWGGDWGSPDYQHFSKTGR